ncbi:hypothetical protein B2J86_13965 [Acidovorax sp. SRB_14]|nr:hypothetical protein [Acidovorax sp. SRB_14]
MFETLNTRGKDLATADLLKNHLARLLREKNSHGDSVKVKWSTMSDNIKAIGAEDVDLDMFIYHYWLAKNNFVQKRDLFKVAKNPSKTKQQPKSYSTNSSLTQKLIEIYLR